MYAPVGGESNNGLTVDVAGRPFTADGEMVSGSYFAVLGVSRFSAGRSSKAT